MEIGFLQSSKTGQNNNKNAYIDINPNYLKHKILFILFSTRSTAIYYIRLLKGKCSLDGSCYLKNVFSCTLLDKHINFKISENHHKRLL